MSQSPEDIARDVEAYTSAINALKEAKQQLIDMRAEVEQVNELREGNQNLRIIIAGMLKKRPNGEIVFDSMDLRGFHNPQINTHYDQGTGDMRVWSDGEVQQ